MIGSAVEAILERIKNGESLERAELRDLDLNQATLENVRLSRSDLEGANFEGANLRHADLSCASLREAYMAGADLERANLQKANLESCNLDGANLQFADLRHANLGEATFERANLKGARLSYAQIDFADLGGALLTGAQLDGACLHQAYLGGADLTNADLQHIRITESNLEDAKLAGANLMEAVLTHVLSEGVDFTGACLRGAVFDNTSLANSTLKGVDLRNCRFLNSNLDRATLTAAKLFGIEVLPDELGGVLADWVDFSVEGNQVRVAGSELVDYYLRLKAGLNAISTSNSARSKRYFGQGDVLRGATLEFSEDCQIEIESYLENCTIRLGHGSILIVGSNGVLEGCQIVGSGDIVIAGKFLERGACPGIVGPRRLHVWQTGTVVAAIQQASTLTEFGFEHGCSLSLRIRKSSNFKGENNVRKSNHKADCLGGRNGV
ncbi:MAG: pentapeptide repeat-containing protein [Acidobacteria bacterium]|nr:pentapeptide repeat-containing protein [Acidobacteriota bacterium]